MARRLLILHHPLRWLSLQVKLGSTEVIYFPFFCLLLACVTNTCSFFLMTRNWPRRWGGCRGVSKSLRSVNSVAFNYGTKIIFNCACKGCRGEAKNGPFFRSQRILRNMEIPLILTPGSYTTGVYQGHCWKGGRDNHQEVAKIKYQLLSTHGIMAHVHRHDCNCSNFINWKLRPRSCLGMSLKWVVNHCKVV